MGFCNNSDSLRTIMWRGWLICKKFLFFCNWLAAQLAAGCTPKSWAQQRLQHVLIKRSPIKFNEATRQSRRDLFFNQCFLEGKMENFHSFHGTISPLKEKRGNTSAKWGASQHMGVSVNPGEKSNHPVRTRNINLQGSVLDHEMIEPIFPIKEMPLYRSINNYKILHGLSPLGYNKVVAQCCKLFWDDV